MNSEHPPKMPRKKFQWSNELRERLYEVYQARWTSYAVLGKRKDSLEQFISGYLKEKIVDLWATGWMRYEELQREIERYKNASKKSKEKVKRLSTASAQTGVVGAATAAVVPAATANNNLTAAPASTANNYLKQFDELTTTEQSRSRANSDTDSATSASSNSMKRKLDFPTSSGAGSVVQPKECAKPPKIKFQNQLVATLAQMSQAAPATGVESLPLPLVNTYLKQFEELTVTTQSLLRGNSDTVSVASGSSSSLKRKLEVPSVGPLVGTVGAATQTIQQTVKAPKKKCTKQQQSPQPANNQLDTLSSQPSTSAQAAALNAAVVAAAASMLELASVNSATVNSPTVPIVSHPLGAVHSTTNSLGGASRTVPHIINLDDYKSPSDILQTSQQLAASKWQAAAQSSVQQPQAVPPSVVRCESSSESDGVEIVGVFPAAAKVSRKSTTKPRSKPSQKSKAMPAVTTGIVPNGVNGGLGYKLDNMYIQYNNNNAGSKLDGGVIRTAVSPGVTTSLTYDVTKSPQILQKLSELSALEKKMNWAPRLSADCDLNAARAHAGIAGTATGASQASSAGAGAGTGQSTNQ